VDKQTRRLVNACHAAIEELDYRDGDEGILREFREALGTVAWTVAEDRSTRAAAEEGTVYQTVYHVEIVDELQDTRRDEAFLDEAAAVAAFEALVEFFTAPQRYGPVSVRIYLTKALETHQLIVRKEEIQYRY
jgi:hypothetical protein